MEENKGIKKEVDELQKELQKELQMGLQAKHLYQKVNTYYQESLLDPFPGVVYKSHDKNFKTISI